MEKLLLERLNVRLDPLCGAHSLLRFLSTARSLLTNPDSSDSTRRVALETLIRSMDHHRGDPTFLRHAIKVSGDAVVIHRHFVSSVVDAVRSLLDGGMRLAADALAVLGSVAESGGEGGGGLSLVSELLDEDLVLSLASSPIVSVRSQLIDLLLSSVDGAEGSSLLQPHLMVRVFLGLAVDIYPSVRRAAVDGIVAL